VSLPLPRGIQILVATESVDLRKSFDGLAAVAREVLRQDPMSGQMFVFRNREGHRCKALLWDRTGWLILYKRLENGRFRFPVGDGTTVEVDAEQLRLLLDGIELGVRVRRRGAS
jgi:transposase